MYSVRAATTPAECDAFFRLGCETFTPDAKAALVAPAWQRHVEASPEYVPGQIRVIFDGSALLGGYLLGERQLRLGSAIVPAGCLSSLAVHPNWRGRGIATALMHDAATRAVERRLGMILLDGIADFYQRFGYRDILDPTRHTISRAQILALPPSRYQARPASAADAPALLALYERHFASYNGSFVRDLSWQQHDLAGRIDGNPPIMAMDDHGLAHGYLLLPWHAPRHQAVEAAADDWQAAVALLQYHAASAETAELDWPLPPDSLTFYALADQLYLTSRSHHHPNEGWMARPAYLPALLEALRARINNPAVHLHINEEEDIIIAGLAPASDLPITLPARYLPQLLFGFRPVSWIARQPGVRIPEALLPAMAAIFPAGHAWIPGSDAF